MAGGAFLGGIGGVGSGALAGGAIGGPIGAGIGAAIGGIAGLFGGSGADQQAEAAQQIAMQQEANAQANRQQALGFAMPSANELSLMSEQLAQYQRMNSFQQQELGRAESTLNAINPTIMQSSKNLLVMLQGGTSDMEGPAVYQRQQQRKQLEDNLRQTMGSGYASSTAAQQALQNFDRQTTETLQNIRFTGMNQMAGIGQVQQGTAASIAGTQYAGAQTSGNLLGGALGSYQNIAQRQVGALVNTPTVPTAGGQYMGQYIGGGLQAQMGQNLMNTGGMLAGMSMNRPVTNVNTGVQNNPLPEFQGLSGSSFWNK